MSPTPSSPIWAANAGLIVTVLMWGTPIPLFDILLARWDPVALASLRYLVAVPVLLLALWLTQPRLRGLRLRPEGVGWGRLFLLGGPGMAGFAIFFLLGLDNSDPVTVAVLAACSPVIAAFVAWLFYREPPPAGIALALALAVAGGVLVRADFSTGAGGLRFEGGEPLILIAITCWTWYSIAAQRAMPNCPQIHLTAATAAPASLVLILFYGFLVAIGAAAPPPAAPSPGDIGLIVWLSLSTVVFGILTWNFGVKRLGLVVAAMFLNLIPVIGVLTAAALGTAPRAEQLLGGGLILAGVIQAQLRSLDRRRARQGAAGPP